jgi:hypothetical protein
MATKKVKVELDHDHGDIVYLVTDPYQYKRIVKEIRLLPGGVAVYILGFGEDESGHYTTEISESPDPEMKRDEE